jgi:O-succinylbenzoate synthase
MKIWAHPYQLITKKPMANPRLGALLKVEWSSGQVGYSDLHPWPEFGDQELDIHLERIAELNFTPLTELSLEFNFIDREFRLHNRSVFLGLLLPSSHLLVDTIEDVNPSNVGLWKSQGFTHAKVKVAGDWQKAVQVLNTVVPASELIWRLDLNGNYDAAEFQRGWLQFSPETKQRIDFVEDPIANGNFQTDGPWAEDFIKKNEFSKVNPPVRVVKPMREELENLEEYRRVVFTHGLDHPLGQASALWSAAQYYRRHPQQLEVCGLGAPTRYLQSDFSKAWSCTGPRMKPVPGTGFGFDELLADTAWDRLV